MASVCAPKAAPWDYSIEMWDYAHILRNPSQFQGCLSKRALLQTREAEPNICHRIPRCPCSLITTRRRTYIHILYTFHGGFMTALSSRQNRLLHHFTKMESKVREEKWIAQSCTLHTYCRWEWSQVCWFHVPWRSNQIWHLERIQIPSLRSQTGYIWSPLRLCVEPYVKDTGPKLRN